jgi:hypothetical protein
MQEALKILAKEKTRGEQNGHNNESIMRRKNYQPPFSRPLIYVFLPRMKAPHKEREPILLEMQEQL